MSSKSPAPNALDALLDRFHALPAPSDDDLGALMRRQIACCHAVLGGVLGDAASLARIGLSSDSQIALAGRLAGAIAVLHGTLAPPVEKRHAMHIVVERRDAPAAGRAIEARAPDRDDEPEEPGDEPITGPVEIGGVAYPAGAFCDDAGRYDPWLKNAVIAGRRLLNEARAHFGYRPVPGFALPGAGAQAGEG